MDSLINFVKKPIVVKTFAIGAIVFYAAPWIVTIAPYAYIGYQLYKGYQKKSLIENVINKFMQ